MKCRHCCNKLEFIFLDLGYAPPSNAYITEHELRSPEATFPLKLYLCDNCWLVQTEDYAHPEDLFSKDYAYFSSISHSWLQHASNYSKDIIRKLNLSSESFVIEVASNDGYLLRNFLAAGIPCLGIEPTDSTADASEKIGVPVLRDFFGTKTAKELVENGKSADLICGNNVYAHVPDINDFTKGLSIVLKEEGTVNLEFPHLMRLIEFTQFDTVYHEHFSYLSFTTVSRIFSKFGLRIFDVEELKTHGGSLRIYGCHEESAKVTKPSVTELLKREENFGLKNIDLYSKFQNKADNVKNNLLKFLIEQKEANKKVAAYGAAAKGNTILNYAGIKPDLIEFVCDAAPSKQGKFLPGSHIPILPPELLSEYKPEWIIILPWNISEEVISQKREIVARWGGKFIVVVPELKVLA